MRHPPRLAAVLLCATALGCGSDTPLENPGDGPAPVLASPNVAVGATVGQPVSYDASKGGAAFTGSGSGGLQYQITFEGATNGLSASGATVIGQPLAPGVTWATITATDAAGRKASDRFAIVAFRPGLRAPALPATPFHYADSLVPLPAHFHTPANGRRTAASTDNTPADNPVTDAGATLGRVLFYDVRLSASDGLSCAGCHSQATGFSDAAQRSVGFAGGVTGRHSPTLANARFYSVGRFFWDERAPTLENQVLRPIQDPVELGLALDDALAKIAATPYYPPLFQAAFGSPEVTSDRVSRALAQFVRSLVSTGSRYDRAFDAEGAPSFTGVLTPQEIEGERLFRSTGCVDCHITVAQVTDAVRNTGLDPVSADTGAGRGRFKAPSLRNVGVRPRFMHDGRFTSLEEVVEFYNSGVRGNPNLDPRLRSPDGSPKRLNLTEAQKAALVAFLHTLTDPAFLTAPRFSNPFAPPAAAPPPGS